MTRMFIHIVDGYSNPYALLYIRKRRSFRWLAVTYIKREKYLSGAIGPIDLANMSPYHRGRGHYMIEAANGN
jgi:hypothetical protein